MQRLLIGINTLKELNLDGGGIDTRGMNPVQRFYSNLGKTPTYNPVEEPITNLVEEPIANVQLNLLQLAGYGGIMILAMYGLNGISSCYRQKMLGCGPAGKRFLKKKRPFCPINLSFLAITAVNGLVYVAWQQPNHKPTMSNYFMLSSMKEVNAWNLVLPAFSHQTVAHLLTNMIILHATLEIWRMNDHRKCTMLESCHGGEFACFYMSSAIVSNFCGLATKVTADSRITSLGCAGVVCSMIAYELCSLPNMRLPFRLPGGYPMTTRDVMFGLVAFDLIGLIQTYMPVPPVGAYVSTLGIDYAVHVGGYTFGAWYAHGGDCILLDCGKLIAEQFLHYF